jgi:hypothetical protein
MTTNLLLRLLILLALAGRLDAALHANQLNGFGASEKVEAIQSWQKRATAAGGTIDGTSARIARDLLSVIKGKSYAAKITHLYPFLGGNLAAARTPLIYNGAIAGSEVAANVGFLEADYTFATGLKGNGSTKRLDTGVKPSQVGVSNSGGMGWRENGIDTTGTGRDVMGSSNGAGTQWFVINLNGTNSYGSWGAPANAPTYVLASTNGRYYSQRSSSTSRAFYKNGASVATNATADTATGAPDNAISLFAVSYSSTFYYWKGRCACAYFTDGTMSGAEITDFDQVLVDYLLTPTGR